MISSNTKILGVFGYPIKHSLSPIMHNAAIQKMKLDYAYLPLEVKPVDLKNAVESIRALGITGVNNTIPHKETIIKFLDKISADAKKIGAVNTVVNKNGILTGYNTDYYGFLRSISEHTKLKNKTVFMLGCGGVSKAIAFALFDSKIKNLFVSDIDIKRAKKFLTYKLPAGKIKVIEHKNIANVIPESDIFINATPVGMKAGDPSPISKNLLRKNLFIYDVVYNRKTVFSADAKNAGAKYADGMDMLVYQGAKSLQLWTGKTPPVELMKETLRKALGKK